MVVQMRVDVGRGAEVAMPQPFLNLLHGNAFRQQQACAAVPEIVQADDTHVVLLQQSPETVGQRVGLETFSQFIDADVIQVFGAVGTPAELAVTSLFLLLSQQELPEAVYQGQRTHAGLGLGGISRNLQVLSIHVAGCDRMLDGQRISTEVNGRPPEPQTFTLI